MTVVTRRKNTFGPMTVVTRSIVLPCRDSPYCITKLSLLKLVLSSPTNPLFLSVWIHRLCFTAKMNSILLVLYVVTLGNSYVRANTNIA
jgi:hypothetical protein